MGEFEAEAFGFGEHSDQATFDGLGGAADEFRFEFNLIATLFGGMTSPTVRVTRIRSDIAQTAMTVDLQLQASADQSEVSNVRQVTQSINETCPLYDGCNQVGTGTVAQPRNIGPCCFVAHGRIHFGA